MDGQYSPFIPPASPALLMPPPSLPPPSLQQPLSLPPPLTNERSGDATPKSHAGIHHHDIKPLTNSGSLSASGAHTSSGGASGSHMAYSGSYLQLPTTTAPATPLNVPSVADAHLQPTLQSVSSL